MIVLNARVCIFSIGSPVDPYAPTNLPSSASSGLSGIWMQILKCPASKFVDFEVGWHSFLISAQLFGIALDSLQNSGDFGPKNGWYCSARVFSVNALPCLSAKPCVTRAPLIDMRYVQSSFRAYRDEKLVPSLSS